MQKGKGRKVGSNEQILSKGVGMGHGFPAMPPSLFPMPPSSRQAPPQSGRKQQQSGLLQTLTMVEQQAEKRAYEVINLRVSALAWR